MHRDIIALLNIIGAAAFCFGCIRFWIKTPSESDSDWEKRLRENPIYRLDEQSKAEADHDRKLEERQMAIMERKEEVTLQERRLAIEERKLAIEERKQALVIKKQKMANDKRECGAQGLDFEVVAKE